MAAALRDVRSQGEFGRARRTSIASRAGAVKAGRRAWLAAGPRVARLRIDSVLVATNFIVGALHGFGNRFGSFKLFFCLLL